MGEIMKFPGVKPNLKRGFSESARLEKEKPGHQTQSGGRKTKPESSSEKGDLVEGRETGGGKT